MMSENIPERQTVLQNATQLYKNMKYCCKKTAECYILPSFADCYIIVQKERVELNGTENGWSLMAQKKRVELNGTERTGGA